MNSLMFLIPAVLMVVGCAAQDVPPTPTTQATADAALNTAINTAVPTPTPVTPPTPADTPFPIPTPTEVYEAVFIVVPTRVPPGTPLYQSWRLETAVRPEGAGNITLSPRQENQMYDRGSTIIATANCDVDFLRWEGDIPDGSDKTANPMTIIMAGPRILYLICVDPLQTPTGIPTPTPDTKSTPTPMATPITGPTALPVPIPTLTLAPEPTLAVSPRPPSAVLTIGEQDQTAGLGTYCWSNDSGVGICADMYGLPTAQEPLIAESPLSAHFQFFLDRPAPPLELWVNPVTVNDQLDSEAEGLRWWQYNRELGAKFSLPLERETTVELSLEPGLYVFEVFADWTGLGEVTYGFLVEVR